MQQETNGKAIGIVETSSIALGFQIGDTVLKSGNVQIIVNRTICPGKYMVLVGGDVDAVNASVEAAISGVSHLPELKALGVIEGFSVASIIEAADAAAKAAPIKLVAIHLAMAIGGKAFVTLTGDVASVEEAVQVGAAVVERKGLLVEKVVIAAPRKEIVQEFI